MFARLVFCSALFWLLFPQTYALGKIKSQQFAKPVFCKDNCHEQVYWEWEISMHSQSYQDPLFQRMLQIASREAGEETARSCIKCHAPTAHLSKEVPPLDGSKMSDISKRGVSCDFCHTITGFEGEDPGDGNYKVKPGNVKLGPYSDSFCQKHDSKYSSLHKSSAFCGICHQFNHPDSDIGLINTYEEWNESDYNEDDPEKNVECQHCHMSPGITKFVPRPGKNDLKGPNRDHVAMHGFIATNSLFTADDLISAPSDFKKRRREAIKKRIQAAAALKVSSAKIEGQKLNLTVEVGAKGTGHKLPTGSPEREVWLEVTVFDNYGEILYQTEEPASFKQGEVGIFRLVLGDKSNHETFKIWEAEKILSDTRIKPKEVREVKYKISVPPKPVLPLTVRVKLLYRSVPPRVTDIVFGKGEGRAPILEMGRVSAKVK
jgi:hypothetical protein